MKNNIIEDFAAYLLQKHYTAGTTESYCRSLKRLRIDYTISEPALLYENIKMRLETYSSNVSARAFAITKVAANRYFEMLTGQSISSFEISRQEKASDKVLDEFYQYSVGFKNISDKAANAECRHIRTFLKEFDEKNLLDYSAITVSDVRNYITGNFSGQKPSSIGRISHH